MPLMFGHIRLNVGDVDAAGRKLVTIAKEYVFKRSRQEDPVALCVTVDCNHGEGGKQWSRAGKNVMGTGSRHAAAFGHKVVVTRHMVTEYDGELARHLQVVP